MKALILKVCVLFTTVLISTTVFAENHSAKTVVEVFDDGFDPLTSSSEDYEISMFACPSSTISPACAQTTTSFSGNTINAANDCALRGTNDYVVQVNIPYDGSWTFTTCNATTNYDTWLYVGTSCCGSQIGNDDDDPACGVSTLRSTVTATITAGTYYAAVEGFSGTGNFQLDVIANDPLPGTGEAFGTDEWLVYGYNGNNYNTLYGFYNAGSALTQNTTTQWPSNGTPSSAASWDGCTVPSNNHSFRYKRKGFPCGIYQIDIAGHDDNAYMDIDGTTEWFHNGCCDAHTNIWTGLLDSNSEVLFGVREFTGGSNLSFSLVDVTTALNPGSHSTTTLTGCVGANYGNLNANAASGGVSAGVTGGSTAYQWQESFNSGAYTSIVGATGEDYNPPALNTIGTYDFRREVTDECGNVAYTTPRRYNIIADPTISLAASTNSICPGETVDLTATTSGGTGTCTFVWQSSANAGGPWTTLATNTSTTFTTAAINSNTYYRVQRNCTGSGCGDPFSNSELITLDDTTDPTISCPANISVNVVAGTCGAVATYTAPVGTDNCPGASTSQIVGLASGATFPVGITTNTFEVEDASGNTATCSFTVTVTDNEDPQISCPANISVDTDAGICGAVVTYTAPVGTDNCPLPSTTQTAGLASGATFPVGITTNTFEVEDAAGNTATCSFTITVTDNEDPSPITCPANITQDNDTGVCGAIVTFTDPAFTDNCPGATISADIPSGSLFPIGTTTVTYTASDTEGNTSTCTFDVIINDTEAPTISCPANITIDVTTGVCDLIVAYAAPTTSDNCPGETVLQTAGLPSGAPFPVGITTNTFEVTDASGNTETCSFDVSVTLNGTPFDFVLPFTTACTGEGVYTNQLGGTPVVASNPGDSGVYSGLGVTDNGNGTFDFDPSIPGFGTHNIQYTYNDGAGCIYSETKQITVTEGPMANITCPSPLEKDCLGPFNCSPIDLNPATIAISSGSISGSATAYMYGDPNPGGDLFIDFPNIPTDTPLELIYTVTTTDGCSSSASCTFEVKSKQSNAGKF